MTALEQQAEEDRAARERLGADIVVKYVPHRKKQYSRLVMSALHGPCRVRLQSKIYNLTPRYFDTI